MVQFSLVIFRPLLIDTIVLHTTMYPKCIVTKGLCGAPNTSSKIIVMPLCLAYFLYVMKIRYVLGQLLRIKYLDPCRFITY